MPLRRQLHETQMKPSGDPAEKSDETKMKMRRLNENIQNVGFGVGGEIVIDGNHT